MQPVVSPPLSVLQYPGLNYKLFAYWNLNSVWTDAMGRGNTLVPGASTAAPTFVAGKIANGANFASAQSQLASVANNADLSVGDIDFTIRAWVYLATLPTTNGIFDLVTKVESGTVRDYRLFVKNTSGTTQFQFYIANGSGTVSGIAVATPALSSGKWYHVLAWHDSVNNLVCLQIDNSTIYSTPTTGAPGASYSTVRLGTTGLGGSNLNGKLDEIGFWKRILTIEEKNYLYGVADSFPFKFGPKYDLNFGNIFMVGDSKTVATTDTPTLIGYLPLMATGMNTSYVSWIEKPTRYAVQGLTMADLKANLPGVLAGLTDVPAYVLINMGVTDLHTSPYVPLPVTWQGDYSDVLDMLHVKWPYTKIYIMRVWKRILDSNWIAEIASMDNTFIPALAAARSAYCFVGPDERVFLENGDDGAALTTDGIHPNHAGYVATAAAWRTAIGL
jgi:lysophospholipase L1-like esterase